MVIVTGKSKVQSSKHNKHNIQNWESPPCRLAVSDVLSSSVLDRKLSDSAVLIQGLVNVPFWVYWTSLYSSHYRPLIPTGWVM